MILKLQKLGNASNIWEVNSQLSMDAFTLHAIGWCLHDIRIGAGQDLYMFKDDEGLLLLSPVRIIGKVEVAMNIDIMLSPNPLSETEKPFIVIEPRQQPAARLAGFVGPVRTRHRHVTICPFGCCCQHSELEDIG